MLEEIKEKVIAGDEAGVKELTQKLVDSDEKPVDIINNGLIAGMSIVGDRFKKAEMYVPEVLMAAKAMKGGMEIVKPLLAEGEQEAASKVLLGTVKGDLHDIGKNLVGMMMESGGFEVIDMGVDITPEDFAKKVKEEKPDFLGLSALLTTTMLAMRETIEVLEEEGLRDSVKIIIGGAPVTSDFADEIGADGYAPDAASATELAEKLLEA